MSTYTEETLVQQTTAEYLERKLGWESVYAYNTETFGPEGCLNQPVDHLRSLQRRRSGVRPAEGARPTA